MIEAFLASLPHLGQIRVNLRPKSFREDRALSTYKPDEQMLTSSNLQRIVISRQFGQTGRGKFQNDPPTIKAPSRLPLDQFQVSRCRFTDRVTAPAPIEADTALLGLQGGPHVHFKQTRIASACDAGSATTNSSLFIRRHKS